MPSAERWRDIFWRMGALWITDQNPKRPHALLTSGLHSGCFFNGEKVMEIPEMLNKVAYDLAEKVVTILDPDFRVIDSGLCGVVGPALGAITLAHDLARNLDGYAGRGSPRKRIFVEKDPENPDRMKLGRCEIEPGKTYLVCEDVITTAGSTRKTIECVKAAGGLLYPGVAAIFNRSGLSTVDGLPIVALIDKHLPTWKSEDCPLCKAGSEVIRPKNPAENWARLCANY